EFVSGLHDVGAVAEGFDFRDQRVLGGEGNDGGVSGVLAGFDGVAETAVLLDLGTLRRVVIREPDAAKEVPGVDGVDAFTPAGQLRDGAGGGDGCDLHGFRDAELEGVRAGFVADY